MTSDDKRLNRYIRRKGFLFFLSVFGSLAIIFWGVFLSLPKDFPVIGKVTGIVSDSGIVRYEQYGKEGHVSLAELGFTDKGLEKGDKLMLNVDSETGKVKAAFTEQDQDELQKKMVMRTFLFIPFLIVMIIIITIHDNRYLDAEVKEMKFLDEEQFLYEKSIKKKQTSR